MKQKKDKQAADHDESMKLDSFLVSKDQLRVNRDSEEVAMKR